MVAARLVIDRPLECGVEAGGRVREEAQPSVDRKNCTDAARVSRVATAIAPP
jgi:hypothetical protein